MWEAETDEVRDGVYATLDRDFPKDENYIKEDDDDEDMASGAELVSDLNGGLVPDDAQE